MQPSPEIKRNEHLTFRANMGVGRHGWLRLTPAYGVRLVRDKLKDLDRHAVITDPFSGTGTTPLAAAELGHLGQSVDINPFLVWLGKTKTANFSDAVLQDTLDSAHEIVESSRRSSQNDDFWKPNLHNIEKWWSPGALHALSAMRSNIDTHTKLGEQVRDLLDVAFCKTLISCSNASFNHQSMSFKDGSNLPTLFSLDEAESVYTRYLSDLEELIQSAQYDLEGSASIIEGDSRDDLNSLQPADLVLTSPPYVNRMSYIRELRPYMYWLRYLDQASDAGDLDWEAIGGTWGSATSKLKTWKPTETTPIDDDIHAVTHLIATDGGKSGTLLANYVHKYHHDMWLHFKAITQHLKPGGSVSYIIGNSTFYGHEVPAHKWYAEMLKALGFKSVKTEIIRKRNSNKALFEFDVTGTKPR